MKENYDESNNKELNIKEILMELSEERDVFNSEADFQFSFAWKIKEYYKEKYTNEEEFKKKFKVKLEYAIEVNKQRKRVDIMVIKDGVMFPIELKYKTKTFKDKEPVISKKDDESYCLANQGAKNLACYDYIKDIKKIEDIKYPNKCNDKDKKFGNGYVIMLTNDANYKKCPNDNVAYKDFSIHDGRKIEDGKLLQWNEKIKNNPNKKRKNNETRNEKIELRKSYDINWEKDYYSQISHSKESDEKMTFWKLITEVK